MKRPFGITVVAVVLLLNGAICALHAAVLYTHPDIGRSFTSEYLRHEFPTDRELAAAQVGWLTLGAISSLVTGGGLWFLSELARWGVLVTAGLPLARGAAYCVPILATEPENFGRYLGVVFSVRMLICAAIVYYLTRPDVRNAFGPYDRYMETFEPARPKTPKPEPQAPASPS